MARGEVRPALIKIDVEGHDLAVLMGAEAVLAQCEPLVPTEFGPQSAPVGSTGKSDADRLFGFCRPDRVRGYAIVWQPGGSLLVGRPRRMIALDAAAMASTRVKMIFLVPPRLQDDFAAMAGRGGVT